MPRPPDPEGLDAVLDAWGRGIAPPTRLTVSQWAEQERILAGVGASEPGAWRNSRTPYLVEPMDRLSPSDPCRVVVLKFGAQLGKTETGLNWQGFIVAHAPAPTMLVQPTELTTKAVVAQRLEPMIEATPAVRALVTRSRAKEDGSSQYMKRFPGGMLRMAWANSPATLRSMPAANLFFDEVDAEVDESTEGDFIDLGLARSRTFPRRKALITSTPGILRTSRVERWYRRGDQRQYRVPCPYCNAFQVLTLAGLQWPDRDANGMPEPGSVHYRCEACEGAIEERWKADMLPAGAWTPTAKGEPRVHSYHLPSLYSPLGWLGWEDIARMHVEAYQRLKEERDPSKMKVFVNTIEGRGWDDTEETAQADWQAVQARAEPYAGTVPDGVFVLTAGIDTQDDRLEASVYGWGPGEESWLLEHAVFAGDPGRDEVWGKLEEWLGTTWPGPSGDLPIVSWALDTGGHFTQEAYAFVRRAGARGMAIKGSNQREVAILGKPTRQDVNWRGSTVAGGVLLWPVGTHRAKELLARRLKIADAGPGRIHTPEGLFADPAREEDFYQQLCGEKRVVRHSRGVEKVEWVKVRPSQRVEAWDCLVYGYAALTRLGMTPAKWAALEAARERAGQPRMKAPRPPVEQGEGPPARTIPSSPRGPRRAVTRSRWLGR